MPRRIEYTEMPRLKNHTTDRWFVIKPGSELPTGVIEWRERGYAFVFRQEEHEAYLSSDHLVEVALFARAETQKYYDNKKGAKK